MFIQKSLSEVENKIHPSFDASEEVLNGPIYFNIQANPPPQKKNQPCEELLSKL